MQRTWMAVMVISAAAAVCSIAFAQGGMMGSGTKSEGAAEGETAMEHPGMHEGMDCSKMQPGEMTGHCMRGMKAEGMGRPMRMRNRMFLDAELSRTDPCALLAVREELGLTGAQVVKLEAIAARAAADAAEVLTDDQKEMLSEIPDEPKTMMGMHRHMMRHMKGKKGEAGMEGRTMCPMMYHMQKGAAMMQEGSAMKHEGSEAK